MSTDKKTADASVLSGKSRAAADARAEQQKLADATLQINKQNSRKAAEVLSLQRDLQASKDAVSGEVEDFLAQDDL